MWLVETKIDGRPYWVRCSFFELRPTAIEWTADANKATKLPRSDAEDLAQRLCAIATEHVWIDLDAGASVEPRAGESSGDFDQDLARVDSLRDSSSADIQFLLTFIDNLWREYSRANSRASEPPSGVRIGDCVTWNCIKGVVQDRPSVTVRWQDTGLTDRIYVRELKTRNCDDCDRPPSTKTGSDGNG